MKNNTRGQIGPMSLEDIYPMAMAFIIVFVFLAYIFSTVSGNLQQKGSESEYRAAIELSEVLASRSVFVYGKKPGLMDAGKLDEYSHLYEELVVLYGLPGYGFSIEVRDLADESRTWVFGPESLNDPVVLSTPVAVRYRVDLVHEGLLYVKVWRT